jgi:hypothetical protein
MIYIKININENLTNFNLLLGVYTLQESFSVKLRVIAIHLCVKYPLINAMSREKLVVM